jgi:hypothetical protein
MNAIMEERLLCSLFEDIPFRSIANEVKMRRWEFPPYRLKCLDEFRNAFAACHTGDSNNRWMLQLHRLNLIELRLTLVLQRSVENNPDLVRSDSLALHRCGNRLTHDDNAVSEPHQDGASIMDIVNVAD